jgi:hypothetical protein
VGPHETDPHAWARPNHGTVMHNHYRSNFFFGIYTMERVLQNSLIVLWEFNCPVGIEPATRGEGISHAKNLTFQKLPVESRLDLGLIIGPGTQQFVPRWAPSSNLTT